MRRADIGAAALFVAIGIYVFVETAGYPGSLVPDSPGAAFFPRLLAGLLFALSAVLVFRAVRGGETEARPRTEGSSAVRPLAALGLVVLFLVLVTWLDFFLLLALLLAAVMALMGERRAKTLVLVPASFIGFVYVVFFRLFGVPFPTFL